MTKELSAAELMRDTLIKMQTDERNIRMQTYQRTIGEISSEIERMAILAQELLAAQRRVQAAAEADAMETNKKVLRIINQCQFAMGLPMLTMEAAVAIFGGIGPISGAASSEAQDAPAGSEAQSPGEIAAASEAPESAPASGMETPPEGGG